MRHGQGCSGAAGADAGFDTLVSFAIAALRARISVGIANPRRSASFHEGNSTFESGQLSNWNAMTSRLDMLSAAAPAQASGAPSAQFERPWLPGFLRDEAGMVLLLEATDRYRILRNSRHVRLRLLSWKATSLATLRDQSFHTVPVEQVLEGSRKTPQGSRDIPPGERCPHSAPDCQTDRENSGRGP